MTVLVRMLFAVRSCVCACARAYSNYENVIMLVCVRCSLSNSVCNLTLCVIPFLCIHVVWCVVLCLSVVTMSLRETGKMTETERKK